MLFLPTFTNLYQVTNDKSQQISIPIHEITDLQKKLTSFVISKNAIELSTSQEKHTFTSFYSRDATFAVINNIWTRRRRLARPVMVAGLKETTFCVCGKDAAHHREMDMAFQERDMARREARDKAMLERIHNHDFKLNFNLLSLASSSRSLS
jgi:hypothetical protein